MWDPGALVLEGRFRVVTALGLSSATETYLAEQLSPERTIGLKVIRPDLGLREGRAERFERETKKLAAVEHGGLVKVIDCGHADEKLYLVTERVDGKSLSTELKGEPLLPERAVELIGQLFDALAALHAKGIVHGEPRPESVMLVAGAYPEQLKLADAGLARMLDAGPDDERVTVVARAIGPIQYLAPECIKGAYPAAESDVYAAGVIAYQMLSGALPANPPKPLAQAAAHLADESKLSALVMRCLEADPTSRPSAAEMSKSLAAMPKPAEPTLYLEAMQRPPELPPAKTIAVPPPLPPHPAPKPAAPAQLMPSVELPAMNPTAPGIDPVLQPVRRAPLPATPARGFPVMPLAVVAVVAIGGYFLFGRSSPASDAKKLIEMHQPIQALDVINHALKKSSEPELVALKAAAQHLSSAHREEAATVKSLGAAPEAVDPLVLGGLAEDFGRAEDAELQTLLRSLPEKPVRSAFAGFAKEPLSPKQWGALRYLDLEKAPDLKWVELYSASLESSSCPVRRTAAKRLAALDDDSAEAALMRLRELPRDGPEKSCGQDEAATALQSLKRTR